MNLGRTYARRALAGIVTIALVTAALPLVLAAPAYAAARVKTITIGDASIVEGNTGTKTLSFTIAWSGSKGGVAPSVHWATAGITATAGADYTSSSGTPTLTNSGCKCATIGVSIKGDTITEGTETFAVNLSSPVNATIGDGQAIGTIYDNEGPPELVVTDVSAYEASGTLAFSVLLTNASASTVTVDYATANGTALAGSDYTATSGTLTFAPGQTSTTVNVTVADDALAEDDETVLVNLTNPANAGIVDAQGIGTILNDDPNPKVSVGNASSTEGNSGSSNMTFTVSLDAASGRDSSIDFTTFDGTATAGSDYTATSGTVLFPAGATQETFTVPVLGDVVREGNETFTVTLVSGSEYNLNIATGTATGTIVDDDPVPTVSVGNVSIAEGNSGNSGVTLAFSLTNPTAATASVNWSTLDGTAVAGTDYTAASGTVTFPPGSTSGSASVPIIGNTTYQANRSFQITISGAVNATLGTGATVTILDDDAAPSLSIGNVTQAETDSGTTTFTFTVTKSGASALNATVNFATADGSAVGGASCSGATDYVSTSGSLTFLPVDTAKTISVSVCGDATYEGSDTFSVNLSGAGNATLGIASGTGTITNDDAAPSLSIGNVTQAETNSGTTTFTFTVTKSGASALNATVNFATADGSAVGGASCSGATDYVSTSGSLTFLPADTTKTISVSVCGDATYEGSDTFSVNLSGAGNATLGIASGTGTITNDDALPTISVVDASVPEGNSGTSPATITFQLTNPSSADVSVDWSTLDGTALAGTDYTAASGTVTIPAGSTSGSASVPIIGNTDLQLGRSFQITISGAANATLGTAGTMTIVDDDGPTLTIDNVTKAETNSGTTTFTFTVTKTGATAVDASVDFGTGDGTGVGGADCTSGHDYVSTSGSLTFLPADTAKTISVSVCGDATYEANDTFTVNLSNPAYDQIGTATGTGTITNDDKQVTKLTGKVTKKAASIKISGLLEPASSGFKVKVTLFRLKGSKWVKVTGKRVSVSGLADRNGNGTTDAAYSASFKRPPKGAYKAVVAFAGTATQKPAKKTVKFKL